MKSSTELKSLARAVVIAGCLLFFPLIAARAQVAMPGDNSATATSLPASRIISILQQNPDVMAEVKRQAAQKLQEQGRPVSESDLSDDLIYKRIQEDLQARVLITQELIDNGYVDPNDPDLSREGDMEVLGASEGRGTPSGDSLPATSASSRSQVRRSESTAQRPQKPITQGESGEIRRKTPPYQRMPALRDLYLQNLDSTVPIDRFGMSLFTRSVGKAERSQMDVPAGPEYVLGPGDGLTVEMWGGISRRVTALVDREGRISLPEIGTVFVAGKTLGEIRQSIPRTLNTQFKNVQADVSLTRLRTVRVYVVGEVESPGAYDIPSLSTVINAVTSAGGITSKGSLRRIRHIRGQKLIRELDLYDLMLKGVQSDPGMLEPGDTLLIPTVGPQVTVSGLVRRPAIYELKDEQSLSQALELAGGVLVTGSLQQIRVERVEPHERRVMLSLDMPTPTNGNGATKQLSQFLMKDGDKVVISSIPVYSNETVFLDGHVLRPGKYSFHPGMTVNELVRSYKDVLPEPSDRAEIVRLTLPEMKPEVIEFNLREILDQSDPIELRPFDTVRIYGRYDMDAPKVSIMGEVLRPGEYPMSHDMNASDLVRLSGGFKRSAFTGRADLASHNVIEGSKVETDHRTVEIGKALQGVPDTDVRLKPGDVLSIHQLSGWEDIGGSVTVKGEVAYPGSYGIEPGEKLSSILRRAGGFRATAYPNGAVLERMQVKEWEKKSREAMIQRVESATPVSKGAAAEQAAAASAFFQQQQQILKRLKDAPISGRQLIKISSDISKWENTPLDIEVRPGDTLIIPKRPNFVLVGGQVNSASAITYVPGKNAKWYLHKAGGATSFGDLKKAFVVRADGSVVGPESGGMWSGGPMGTVLQPGDSVVVPEKIFTGNAIWRNILATAQIMSSVAITAGVVASF